MANLLTLSGYRYLLKHKLHFVLSVLGIAIGVAIIISIDIANFSTSNAFNLSLSSVAGKATHRIIGVANGVSDSVYRVLKTQAGFENLAPVEEDYARIITPIQKTFKLLGVDVFAEKPFRDYLKSEDVSFDGEITTMLSVKNSVLISQDNSVKMNLKKGDTLISIIKGKTEKLVIGGIISSAQNKERLENLIITDISTAQQLTDSRGFISYADVIINSKEEESYIKKFLPENYSLQKSGTRSDIAEQMMSAFNVNLNALSLLALIVGVFLIYNTMTFSVVRRKAVIGTMRALGVTQREIYLLIVKEVLLIGFIGTLLGFILGYFVSKVLISVVSRTINDLYYVVSVNDIYLSPLIIIKAASVGILASLLSALKPAKEASGIKPRISMLRSEQESSIVSKIPRLTAAGLISGAVGAGILLLPTNSVWISYAGILPVIIGFALMTPLIIFIFEKLLTPFAKKFLGITGKISSRGIIQNLSRTNSAVAALGIAVAASLAVNVMIQSFRNTVVMWLQNSLTADLYISAPSLISNSNQALLPDSILTSLMKIPHVQALNYYAEMQLEQDGREYNFLASGKTDWSRGSFQLKEGDSATVWSRFQNGELGVAEPFALKNDVKPEDTLRLNTNLGMKTFKVAGVFYDYSTDKGYIFIEYSHFKKLWNKDKLSGIAVFIDETKNMDFVKSEIQKMSNGNLNFILRTNKAIRDSSIDIFDRTFLIAQVLQIISVIVAFIGIFSALMSLQIERERELGMLRAIGLLPFQLFKIVNLQSLIIGIIAGIISLPLGSLLASLLVFIINKRSFGWTMQFFIPANALLEAMLLAIAASLLAGLYPGIKMSNTLPSKALRGE